MFSDEEADEDTEREKVVCDAQNEHDQLHDSLIVVEWLDTATSQQSTVIHGIIPNNYIFIQTIKMAVNAN